MGRNERVLRRDWSRLDNEGAKVPPIPAALAHERAGQRNRRWRIMRALRPLALQAGLRSVAYCSTRCLEGGAIVTQTPDGCSWSNLQRCKSPHACPRCSLDLAHRNAAQMTKIELAAAEAGLLVDLVTLTHPHDRSTQLDEMLEAVLGTWSRLWRSGTFRKQMRREGFVGAVRAFEATHGANGWHVHLHVALVRRPEGATRTSRLLVERWLAADPSRSANAQDVQYNVGAVAEYVGKGSMRLAAELSHGNATKEGRGGSRSPLELAEAATRGDSQARRLWLEWCEATKGRRAWHIIGRADLAAALQTDEVTEATEPEESVLSPVATFDAGQFAVIRQHKAETVVLSLFEQMPGCALHTLAPNALANFLEWYSLRYGDDAPFFDSR